jgi:hypothetical protein
MTVKQQCTKNNQCYLPSNKQQLKYSINSLSTAQHLVLGDKTQDTHKTLK